MKVVFACKPIYFSLLQLPSSPAVPSTIMSMRCWRVQLGGREPPRGQQHHGRHQCPQRPWHMCVSRKLSVLHGCTSSGSSLTTGAMGLVCLEMPPCDTLEYQVHETVVWRASREPAPRGWVHGQRRGQCPAAASIFRGCAHSRRERLGAAGSRRAQGRGAVGTLLYNLNSRPANPRRYA